MGLSTADLVQLQANLARGKEVPYPVAAYTGPEADLHDKIAQDLQRRRWYFVHSRMDKKASQQKGVPDFIAAAPLGITWWIEVKRKGEKLTKEQNIARHCLVSLDHIYSLIFSMSDYAQEVKRVEARISAMAVT